MTATAPRRPAPPPPAEQSYGPAFPNSTKVHVPGPHGIRVPMREMDAAMDQALLRLVGDGVAHVKVSAAYRVSQRYPDYDDARALHAALLRAIGLLPELEKRAPLDTVNLQNAMTICE